MNLLEIKTKYENEIKKLNNKIKKSEKNYENIVLISNKAKKFDQLKYKLEMELIKDNNYNNYNNNILKDEDLEENITNLIKLKKNSFLEIKKLKIYINNLTSNNLNLKQKLLENEQEFSSIKSDKDKNNKNKTGINIKLKEEMQKLIKENNFLTKKLVNMIHRKTSNDLEQFENEELFDILSTQMNPMIYLEEENTKLKSLLKEISTNNSNANQKVLFSPSNIKLLEENAQYRNTLIKMNKENQELKMKFQNKFANNHYIMSMQKELNLLRKIIEENKSNTDNKNQEYEEKINNLEKILNEKEALLNQYETLEINKDITILNEIIQKKDKIIENLKNKISSYENNIMRKSIENNNYNNNNSKNKNNNEDEKELLIIKYENMNLINNINQLNKEISKIKNINEKLKKENKNLKQFNQELISKNALINKNYSEILQKINSTQNPNLINNEEITIQIKKKEEEIGGLNTFIQKLTNEYEKSREDIKNYKKEIKTLKKENASLKNQLERLSKELPNELNALKSQLDVANKKLSKAKISINNKDNKEKANKTFDDGKEQEKYNSIVSKLNKKISDLTKKNEELLSKLGEKEIKSHNSSYKTEEFNMSQYEEEEEFDLRKYAERTKDKIRSQDINIDYPGIQNYKEKLKEYQSKYKKLEEQIKILLSKVKITNNIKQTFVQICQLLEYDSKSIEKMASSEKEKKKILGLL